MKLKVQVFQSGRLLNDLVFDQFPVVFGRGKDCHIRIDNMELSRSHGSIIVMGESVRVVDLNSKNGIFVSKQPVVQHDFSESGIFSAGPFEFRMNLLKVERQRHSPVSEATLVGERTFSDFDDPERTLIGVKAQRPLPKEDVVNYESPSLSATDEIRCLDLDRGIMNIASHELAVQGAVFWKDTLIDIRQFVNEDDFIIGGEEVDPLHLPLLETKYKFGEFSGGKAKIRITSEMKWTLFEMNKEWNWESVADNTVTAAKPIHELGKHQLLCLNMPHGLTLQFKYARREKPHVEKTWIENRDEFKRSAQWTLAIHFILFAMVIFQKPTPTQAPQVEAVPERFARLLVEPPAIIAPPPPVVVAPPPPPPPVENKPVEPPPEVVKKIVEKRELAKKTPPIPPRPQRKVAQAIPPRPVPEQQVAEPQEELAIQEETPQVSEAESQAQDLASLFEDSTPAPAPDLSRVNIKTPPSGGTASGPSTKDVMNTLKSSQGTLESNPNSSAKLGLGGVGYSQGNKGVRVGGQRVAGQVLGKPDLKPETKAQGLTQEQVMTEVNKHLSRVQQCYERALFNNPSLAGRVEFEWTISSRGEVASASIRRSELNGGEELHACVVKLIKSWRFPGSQNGLETTANIGFPFGKL